MEGGKGGERGDSGEAEGDGVNKHLWRALRKGKTTLALFLQIRSL